MSVTESEEKSAVTKKAAVTKKSPTKKVVTKKVAAETITKKTVVAKKTVSKKAASGATMAASGKSQFSQRDRYEMIAKMAYFRAEKRGFEPGWEQQDWLESEKLIDEMLSKA